MTKNNNIDYRKKIYRQRHHRRMKLVESGIGVVVAVIMIFALGQGNLKKNVNGQEEFQPESGTSADISESSTQDMSYSDTEGAAQQYLATAEDAAIPDQRNGQYVQFVNYTNPDVSGKGADKYDSNIYMPANATDDQYFSTSLLIGDSRAEALGLYSGVDNWDMCVAKNLDIEKVANTKMFTCDSGEQCTVVEMLGMKSYENIYISFGLEELSWYNERYMLAYKTLLDQISQLQPAANVYVMSVLPVSAELSSKDQVYNNPGVDKLNSLMQEMCGSYDQVIYLDVAHSVSVDGVLPEDAGIDGKHCNKKYCLKMMDYIRKNVYVRR